MRLWQGSDCETAGAVWSVRIVRARCSSQRREGESSMSSWRHIIMSNQRHAAAALVRDAIFAAPHGSVLVLEEPGKSRLQENKYHPMVRDIASSCEFSGRRYTEHSWKRLMVEAFVNVLRKDAFARGEDDPFPGDGAPGEG